MAIPAGSEGLTRKSTADWLTDTKTYLQGERLLDIDTGEQRVSSGGTYAQAWKGPKHYFGSISQAGTAAPTVTTGGNTVGAIVWARNDAGAYTGTLAGAFPLGSGGYVSLNLLTGIGISDQPYAYLSRQSDDVLILDTGTIDAQQDGILIDAFIHITTP